MEGRRTPRCPFKGPLYKLNSQTMAQSFSKETAAWKIPGTYVEELNCLLQVKDWRGSSLLDWTPGRHYCSFVELSPTQPAGPGRCQIWVFINLPNTLLIHLEPTQLVQWPQPISVVVPYKWPASDPAVDLPKISQMSTNSEQAALASVHPVPLIKWPQA